MPELSSGDIVGEYVLEQPLDEGGQGFIWRARRHNTTSTFVALKLLTKDVSQGSVGELRREIEVLAATAANRSPHIVRVLGGGTEPVPHIVMEYVDGSDLRKELQRLSGLYGADAGRFAQLDAMQAGIAVADALAALHEEGIIHRDVKPANVMLDRRGNIKLTDFGIAKIAGSSPVTVLNEHPLSLSYAAPEVWDGAPVFTSDIYALGVMLFELLSGSPPFHGSTTAIYRQHLSEPPPLGALPPDVDPEFAALINACMTKDATERPTAAACREVLTRIKNELSERERQTQSGQNHEPEQFGAWRRLAAHPERPWAWLGRHRDTGVEAVVEMHFTTDLPALEQQIAQARRMIQLNPRLMPLGAERLIAANRFLLGPSEAWSQEPPGRFSYFIVRAEEARTDPPASVSKPLLLAAARSLSMLIEQARVEGINLDLSPEEVSLSPDGRVHLAHPGLGPQDGLDMDQEAVYFLRSLPLDAEARAVLVGVHGLDALLAILEPPASNPVQDPPTVIGPLSRPVADAEATSIVPRTAAPPPPDEAYQTQIVPSPSLELPVPDPRPTELVASQPPEPAQSYAPPIEAELRPLRSGTQPGASSFQLVLTNRAQIDRQVGLWAEDSDVAVTLPESVYVGAGQSQVVPIQPRPIKGRTPAGAVSTFGIVVADGGTPQLVRGSYRGEESKSWLPLAGIAAVLVVGAIVAFMVLQPEDSPGGGATTSTAGVTARAALDNFDFKTAVDDFTTDIKAETGNTALYSGRASAYLSQADLAKAHADANKAIELDPANAEAYHVRSLVLGTRWNYDESLSDANKAIELDSTNPVYYAARSQIYADREPAKAQQDANKALELGPDVAEAHVALGGLFRNQGKYAEAEAAYEKAISLQPKNGTNYIGRAYLFWVKGDGNQALSKLTADRAVIHSYPLSAAQGHVTRGVFHHGFGQYPEALAEFDKANEVMPGWPAFNFWHGFTSYTRKDLGTALSDYNKGIEIAPSWPSLLYLRSLVHRDQGRFSDALADLNKAVSVDANDASFRSERGLIQYNLKNYPAALADLNQAIAMKPDDPDAYHRRGNVHSAQGNFQPAIEDFNRAIQRKATDLQYYLDRGAAYQRLNRLTEAQADFQKARSLATTADEIQRTQAALDALRR